MAELTLREAAKQVGVSRATIYRAVQEGRLSATVRPHDGQKVVDTAELLRVFGSLKPRQAETASETAPRPEVLELARRLAAFPETGPPGPPSVAYLTAEDRRREVEIADREALRAELDAARDTIRRLEQQAQEAREREAKLMELAASATRLLEHREIPAAPPPRGILRRLFGK